ncbi:Glucose / Sorbosone dehydrogenase [Pseudonocardia thermophila]|jgi:Glucose/sorbosone dehydrogenases|uniref:Glucose / Sorbosone dehydrogenase n=1 Tax=Pseudonocardia thermophila TaxID=1848 RepID=A0A1M6QIE4_PSETH|nr:PQQ-dependent sugar dehydrogenase [Pseudonocardia thermophila]SHK20011.1 Glucose / Sorbosone dehydrogenase [Pseudonocardia thermophila]
MRRAVAAVALTLLVAGCATFPDNGPREWREKIENRGELGGPPTIPDPQAPPTDPDAPGSPGRGGQSTPQVRCPDPDPQVVATCLEPVGAVAPLPEPDTAIVGERTTGRILKVRKGRDPQLITTVEVDPTGGGGLTGLVLSPGYDEDQLLYAYITTRTDNRVVRIAPGEPPKPVLAGIPRGATHNAGALVVDVDGSLLVATGDAGGAGADPRSTAGKVLRIDTLGKPGQGNPEPGSPVLSSGVTDPGGICVDPQSQIVWVTDHAAGRDVLHRVQPGELPAPAWTWPNRPGVAGCMAAPGVLAIAQTQDASLFVLRPGPTGGFTGDPETLLAGTYGRLSAAAPSRDGLLWLGTVNKAGGEPGPTDDRVIHIQPPAGGASKA